MANMDYPGPCMACSAIDGCASEDTKKQAVAQYCKGLDMELNSWKARLYDVVVEFMETDGADKAKLLDTINLLTSTVKELEAVKDEMLTTCPGDMAGAEKNIGGKLENLRVHYTKAMEVIAPGWFGG